MGISEKGWYPNCGLPTDMDHEVVMVFRCLLFLNAQMLAVCHYVWLIISYCFPFFLRIVGCFGSSEHLHWKVMDSAPGQVILSLWHLQMSARQATAGPNNPRPRQWLESQPDLHRVLSDSCPERFQNRQSWTNFGLFGEKASQNSWKPSHPKKMLLMSLLSLQVCCVHTIPMSLRASIAWIHQSLPEETGESAAVWAQVTSSQMSLVHPGNWRMAYRIG